MSYHPRPGDLAAWLLSEDAHAGFDAWLTETACHQEEAPCCTAELLARGGAAVALLDDLAEVQPAAEQVGLTLLAQLLLGRVPRVDEIGAVTRALRAGARVSWVLSTTDQVRPVVCLLPGTEAVRGAAALRSGRDVVEQLAAVGAALDSLSRAYGPSEHGC